MQPEAMQPEAERRSDERLPILTYAQLSVHHRLLGRARTIDLSKSGFAGATDVNMHLHREIGVGINGIGTVYGTVVWIRGFQFAVHFKEPIDLELIDISPMIQPEIILPDWFPEVSSSNGHFTELGAEQYTSPEPVRLVSDKPREEKPRDSLNKMAVEQNGWRDPVRIVSDKPREEKPRDARSTISARIEIRKSGLKKCKADVVDISLTGFQLDCALRLNEGERFFVDLPGVQTLSATVIWHTDLRSGCKFETPISEYIYHDLLGRLSK